MNNTVCHSKNKSDAFLLERRTILTTRNRMGFIELGFEDEDFYNILLLLLLLWLLSR